jgi:crossover junction endodeoxyribonuclease RuvC
LVILGIDPGYAITGYGVLRYNNNRFKVLDYGVIRTSAETPFPERLLAIQQALRELLDMYMPDCVAIEELFFSRNTTTAIGTAQARGVAIVTAASANLPVYEYTPMQVKVAVIIEPETNVSMLYFINTFARKIHRTIIYSKKIAVKHFT